jgi:hypothetical protein
VRQESDKDDAQSDYSFDRQIDSAKDDDLMKPNRDNCGDRREAQNDLEISARKVLPSRPDRKNRCHDCEGNKLTGDSTSTKDFSSRRVGAYSPAQAQRRTAAFDETYQA